MSGQEHARKRNPETTDDTEATAAAPAKSADTEARDAEVDALLDEIDGVLEVNAEEFVAAFVQKGGQ